MRNSQSDNQHRDSDAMETMAPSPAQGLSDSASSESDAGLEDASMDEIMGIEEDDDNVILTGIQEIPMSDLSKQMPAPSLESPELSDLNSPGEVDIEDLDEDDLDGTNLPEDARLDPLED